MNEMQEAIKEFLVESHENLEQLDTDFVVLEHDPGDVKVLGSIFRTVHTIKGSAGLLGYQKLQALAHAGESLLSRLRDGALILTPDMTSTLLGMVDAVRQMLRSIDSAGHDGEYDFAELIEMLGQLRQHPTPAPAAAGTMERPSQVQQGTLAETNMFDSGEISDLSLREGSSELDIELNPTGDARLSQPGASAPPRGPKPSSRTALISPKESATPRETGTRSGVISAPTAPAPTPVAGAIAESTVRIDVGLLDRLMALVSELVLARNQILQHSSEINHPSLISSARQINLITSELQEEVMQTRMQPIGNIVGKFPRVVRDMAVACGKQVRLEIEGSDTELDKSLLEAVRDPLTHLVRNAVDHGIEPSERRLASGKPAEGRIFLRAFHEAGLVNIEISDDGGGIDAERIRQKAVERSLITHEQAAAMSDQTALNMIFLPGFSTAERVTNYSGRGVGMDVVKTNIEKIGGTIDIQSQLGEGTAIRMRIPLTLAIIRGLFVSSSGDRYAIPQVNLVELVRLEADKARTAIERLHNVPVFRYRGKLLPIVYLNRMLGTERDGNVDVTLRVTPPHHSERDDYGEALNIIVLQTDDRHFGLVVDGVSDTQEIVVKPLARQLKGIHCFAGATIMGDGRVALILDVMGLAQRAGVLNKVRELGLAEAKSAPASRSEERQSVLLVRGDAGPLAIPLSVVARIEKFERRSIEQVGGRQLVQYRGEILSLIDVANVLAGSRSADGARPAAESAGEIATGNADHDGQYVQVVVYSDRGRSVGLIVDRVLDVLDEPLTVRGRPSREHVLYTTVLHSQVTEVLNVEGVVRTADPTFFDAMPSVAGGR